MSNINPPPIYSIIGIFCQDFEQKTFANIFCSACGKIKRMKRGFGLLEIVIAASIVSMTIFSLSFVFLLGNRLEVQSISKIRANFLAEEGLEAVRFLRDTGWDATVGLLAVETNYYLSFATSTADWSIGSAYPGFIDGLFNRRVTVEA